MTLALATMLVLALAAMLGTWRVITGRQRWRWPRMLGQWLMAGLLFLLLFPPTIPHSAQTMRVLTPGSSDVQIHAPKPGVIGVVLPGVVANSPMFESVPDLATALRRHPRVNRLEIVGDGLPARDRESVSDLALDFERGPDPVGIIGLDVPYDVGAGTWWSLRGKVAGVPGARLELRDRSGAVVSTASMDPQGLFRFSILARSAGEAVYRLRLLGAGDAMIEDVPIATRVRKGESLRSIVVAGAPDAELKYLRRWAIDAGHAFSTRIALSPGIEQQQDVVTLDAKSLSEADLLIVDERSWAGFSRSTKALIGDAVANGLGLILRVTGALPKGVASDWAGFGFKSSVADIAQSVTIANEFGNGAGEASLSRVPLRIDADDAVVLLSATDGSPLALWRAVGQGRVALWMPVDAYRIQLGGDSARHGSLWSHLFSTAARAHAERTPGLPHDARVGQRSVICGLSAPAAIEHGAQPRVELSIVPGVSGCAAWWPSAAGWQYLSDARGRWPIHVLAEDEAVNVLRAQNRDATAGLVRNPASERQPRAEMPRWPLFLLWLAISALFWWIERRSASAS